MFDFFRFHGLGRIAQIKHFEKVTRISVATAADYVKDGEWIKKTVFNDLVVFQPELIARIREKFAVGDVVRVEGDVQSSSYEKEGEMRYATDLVASRIYRQPAARGNATEPRPQ